ncbi:Purine-cytosine permease fcyB 1 [Phlyctema vagabunda]|uniref:Purine-cytosine permease fcyB 1 n=1 Tax=Phlyctema vagabunda TaxID=108571 RepID=A0ABR4PT84_9HELO
MLPNSMSHDVEKFANASAAADSARRSNDTENTIEQKQKPLWCRILNWGVEENSIAPIPLAQRVDIRVANLFTVWFTALLCLLPIVTGMVGTLSYGLSLRDASLVILFFTLLSTLAPAALGVLGPKTGLRQMIQARYAFGLYAIVIILLLNAASVTGFCVIAAIVGGQCLSAVSDSGISWDVGIVITLIISLALSFSGYKVLHFYERWSWIPVLVAVIVATGCGGSKLRLQATPPPPEAQTILSYGCLIAGFMIPFAGIVCDFSVYIKPETPKRKTFGYVYAGLALPSILLLILGAAIGGAVPNVPSWAAAYEVNSVGGVLAEMLSPAKGFGKFIVVILALSVVGNISVSMYSIALNIQMLHPFFLEVPRSVFTIIVTVILVPVSIKASRSFLHSLENFLGVISYWSAAFVAIMLVEFVHFRKMDYASYDHASWNVRSRLPSGIAALGAGLCSFALVIPSMAQIWYTGPIAEKTGDIGFELAFIVSGLLYLPFRTLEIKLQGRL